MDKQKILEELGGIPEEVYDSLVDEFYNQMSGQLKQMRDCLQSGQLEEFAGIAHSIKGASGNLRIEEIFNIARELELGTKQGTLDDGQRQAILDKLEDSFKNR